MSDNPLRKIGDEWCFCVESIVFDIDAEAEEVTPRIGLLALLCTTLQEFGHRGENTAIAQFYSLVIPGAITARHVFRGLNRNLFSDKKMDADKNKLIYTFRSSVDFEWQGGKFGTTKKLDAKPGKVFYIIVTPNSIDNHRQDFPDVDGWIETWGWVDEDGGLDEAPIGWVDRYYQKLWTR